MSLVEYQMTVKRMMARRQRDSAITTIMISTKGLEVETGSANHQMTVEDQLAAILHLINSAHRLLPDDPLIKDLRDYCDLKLGHFRGFDPTH